MRLSLKFQARKRILCASNPLSACKGKDTVKRRTPAGASQNRADGLLGVRPGMTQS